jgi:hypothetical protein
MRLTASQIKLSVKKDKLFETFGDINFQKAKLRQSRGF